MEYGLKTCQTYDKTNDRNWDKLQASFIGRVQFATRFRDISLRLVILSFLLAALPFSDFTKVWFIFELPEKRTFCIIIYGKEHFQRIDEINVMNPN